MENPIAREKALFLSAMEIADEVERARFLDEQCGDDAALRERLAVLLRMDAEAGKFLEPVAEAGDSIAYFGDYVLLDEIARGASGAVFRARQTSLHRIVALKMLRDRPLLTSDGGKQRFRAEAQAAAALDHPGIVPIYEVGEHKGQGYFSMKYIEGGSLHFRAGEFREPRKAAALIAQVARAVHHAHKHGILHRDLKPGNILIDRTGAPMVVDFGIARQMGADSQLTQAGQIVGTPHYMAPEQARGAQRELTAAADIYSLGAILYELLAGKKPFDGDTMLTLLRQVAEEPPAPLRIGKRELEALVQRCLEKQPAARPASAAELADALERWLRGERLESQPWSRRKVAVALGGMALIGGAASFVWQKKNAPPAKETRPERGSFAASRAAAEWLRTVPKNTAESTMTLIADGRYVPGLRDTEPLPPGDLLIVHLWLDRLATVGLPPVDGDAFARAMGGLAHLQSFYIRLFDLPDSAYAFLSHQPDLAKFVIEGGAVGDELLGYLRDLKNLRELNLQNSTTKPRPFTARSLGQLASLPAPETLVLSKNQIDDSIFPTLQNARELRDLNLSDSQVTDAGIRQLGTLPKLQFLNFDACAGITDASLQFLAGLPGLKRLSVENAAITKAGVEAFKNARPDCPLFHRTE